MSREIQSGEPREIVAGDSVVFYPSNFRMNDGRTLTDFLRSEFDSLAYVFAGEDKVESTSGWFAHSGTSYTGSTVTIPASAFAEKKPGTYRLYAYVSASAGTYINERYSADLGTVILKPNPATAQAGESALSFAERMVRELETQLLAMAGNDITGYSVAGRSVQKAERANLEKQLAKWQHVVWRERNPGKFVTPVLQRFG